MGSIHGIEHLPHIAQCQECGRAVHACRVAKAAPGPIGRPRNHTSGDRIQHDIAEDAHGARAAFDNLGFVSSLKHVAHAAMTPVEPAAIRTVDVLHEPRERMHGRSHQKVHVIRHQAVSVDDYRETSSGALEQMEISSVVDIVNEHFPLVIAAGHDVMQHSRRVNPKRPSHGGLGSKCRTVLKLQDFRPILDQANKSAQIRQPAGAGGVGSFRVVGEPALPIQSNRTSTSGPRRADLVARSLFVRSDRDFEDRFLQKAIAGERRMRVLREEDREVTRRNRKPGGGGILVELNIPLLVKRPNRGVTR